MLSQEDMLGRVHQTEDQDQMLSFEERSMPMAMSSMMPEQDEMLSPENRTRISAKVAAQRAIFSDPVPRRPGPPARDIAGRWHGRPPAYWATCCTTP